MAADGERERGYSRDEVEFLRQGGLYAWKEELTRRIRRDFEALHEALAKALAPHALLGPDGMDWSRWQLVRGERFHDRPYAYLDFPQYFTRDTKFTYRSMFWWGESLFFAIILEGGLLGQYRNNLASRYAELAGRDLALSVADTPWEWGASANAALPLRTNTREEVCAAATSRTFLKVQRAVSLERLSEADAIVRLGVATFDSIVPLIRR